LWLTTTQWYSRRRIDAVHAANRTIHGFNDFFTGNKIVMLLFRGCGGGVVSSNSRATDGTNGGGDNDNDNDNAQVPVQVDAIVAVAVAVAVAAVAVAPLLLSSS